jgi:hypothetical protein
MSFCKTVLGSYHSRIKLLKESRLKIDGMTDAKGLIQESSHPRFSTDSISSKAASSRLGKEQIEFRCKTPEAC